MKRVGDRLARLGRGGRARRRGWLLLGSLVSLMLLGACDSTNSYPIDFFSEMHYQKSYHAQEPPRLDSAPGAIPVNTQLAESLAYRGRASAGPGAEYTQEEAANLQNPLANDPGARARGQELYTLNCVQCHGQEGLGGDTPSPAPGNAFIVIYFNARNQTQPADQQFNLPANLTSDAVKARSDGELYWILTHGFGQVPGFENRLTQMPAFGNLLTPEERWALVAYIRQLQGQ